MGRIADRWGVVAPGYRQQPHAQAFPADPVHIAMLKVLVAGMVNLALALLHGALFPSLNILLAVTVVGFPGSGRAQDAAFLLHRSFSNFLPSIATGER